MERVEAGQAVEQELQRVGDLALVLLGQCLTRDDLDLVARRAEVAELDEDLQGQARVVDRGVQGLDDGGNERQRDVADAEPDDRGFGVGGGEGARSPADLGEQVAGLEVEVVAVDGGHGFL